MLATRANVNIVVAQPPTYANWDNYLVPSLQAVYDFSADKSRIKAVVLCNPHNPLARCYSKKALLELMEWCQEHGLHLVVDEIYALTDLTDVPDKSAGFVSALGLTEPLRSEGAVKIEASRVHTVWSASKVFGMSGFRVVRLPSPSRLLAFTDVAAGLHHIPTQPHSPGRSLPPHNIPHLRHLIHIPDPPPHMAAPPHAPRPQLRTPDVQLPRPRRISHSTQHRLRAAKPRALCMG
jgi:hypothetical protein